MRAATHPPRLLSRVAPLLVCASLAAAPALADVRCPEPAEGRRVTSVRYDGLTLTKPFVVDRERVNREGEPFTCAGWELELRRLQGLDLFADLSLEAVAQGEEVALTYRFIELPRFLVYPAIRRSDIFGWLLGPGIGTVNLLGRDIRLEAYFRTVVHPDPFSSSEFLVRSQSPWIGDVPIEYELVAGRSDFRNDVRSFRERNWELSVDFFHRLSEHFRLVYAVQLLYVSPDPASPGFRAPGEASPRPILVGSSGGDFVPGLGAGVLWDSRDRRVNPHGGIYQELRVTQFGGPIGGPADYRQVMLDHRSWWSRRLLGEMQSILHLSLLARMRPGRMGVYDYFVPGGPNSLRTVDPSAALYAQHEVLGTVEVRQELIERYTVSLLGFDGYFGLQLVAGADLAAL
ncbi:MAG: BamA/TamA family outer membrane protein, partial [Myxococcales bacterium]